MTNEEKKKYIFDACAFAEKTKKMSVFEIGQQSLPFLEKLPKHLYKYRSFSEPDYLEDYIRDDSVFLSSIAKQDDRFEGITPATVDYIRSRPLGEVMEHYKCCIIQYLKQAFPEITENDVDKMYAAQADDAFDETTVKNYLEERFPQEDKAKIEIAVNALSESFKRVESDMQDSDKIKTAIKNIARANDTTGVYCMSEDPSNQPMWSKYADDFKGYCIEYDLSEPLRSAGSIRFIRTLFPVLYQESKDDDWLEALMLSFFIAVGKNGFDRHASQTYFVLRILEMMCTKDIAWEGQKEWRYIGVPNTKIHGPLISTIIVGDKIEKVNYYRVKQYAQRNHYPIFVAYINYMSKTVERKPIDDSLEKRMFSDEK